MLSGGLVPSVRLVSTDDQFSGKVEVKLPGSNQWGAICTGKYHDYWDNADARVVCRELGFRTGYVGERMAVAM